MLDRKLGVHTSIANGIHLSLDRAKKLSCNTVQIFSHNPRQWRVDPLPSDSIMRFKEKRKTYVINPVFIHASYLRNLASVNKKILKKSIRLLMQELHIADLLNADYLVIHTGSTRDGEAIGRKRAIEALKVVSKGGVWRSKILLENTAGESGDISSRLQDLSEIIEKTNSQIIGGICIDTCHAFSAGYNISKEKGITELSEEVEKYIGLEKVKLIHLNDSKKGCGSEIDRHEHIGHGGIGRDGFKRFINYPAFIDIPLILETPKETEKDDVRNLRVVRSLFL